MELSRVPWWVWVAVAWFVLTVFMDADVSLFWLVVAGFALTSFGSRTRPRSRVSGPRPGGAGEVGGPHTSEEGWPFQPGARGEVGEPRPADGSEPLPRIDVPAYPGESLPGGFSAPTASPSTDPVVSLGQLHLGRCARELDSAARAGDEAGVARRLHELEDLVRRLGESLQGTSEVPGSGRRAFGSGLQRLRRQVVAARGEQPPGARVGEVVRGATRLGQTGRYE